MRRPCWAGCWIAPAAAAADRLTKSLALAATAGGDRTLIPGWFSLVRARNTGAAFSLLEGRGALVTAATLLLILLLAGILLADRPPMGRLARAGFWMIVGGGLGNLYDRLFLGYVIDFLRTDFIPFPVFNAADAFVVAGACLACVGVLRAPREVPHG